MKIQDILHLLGANIIQKTDFSQQIEHLCLDSRQLAFPDNSLFFAIHGQRHNGHCFIEELYQKGVRNFIIEETIILDHLMGANILKVDNSILALQTLAKKHREKYKLPILAITGSNGKTIIKEWLTQLLMPKYNVVKSPKSYNSQIGVPLSLWEINEKHNFGIFEAGISKPKEMAILQDMIRPDLAIFSNIGTAHDSGFKSREEKIKEKLMLFKHCKTLFYCKDHTALAKEIQNANLSCKFFCWSKQGLPADLQVLVIDKAVKTTHIQAKYLDKVYDITLPFCDEASIENAIQCLAVMVYLRLPTTYTKLQFKKLRSLAMRLELKKGIHNNYLIDDSYNNDLAGLKIALDFLESNQQKKESVVILSDLLEAGKNEKEVCDNISHLLKSKNINTLIGIGNILQKHEFIFGQNSYFFESTDEFLNSELLNNIKNSLILVKGARVFAFERIVQKLSQKSHRTILEVNLKALEHNLNYYRSLLKKDTKLMVMVKAFAYGSGIVEVGNLLQFHRVDYLAVAYADEGVMLRQNGVTLPIMIMNPQPETFPDLIEFALEPELYSFSILEKYIKFCKETTIDKNKTYKIHLKLDTGMHRLGFEEEEIELLLSTFLKKRPKYIEIASVFSHLAGADESTHNDFSKHQISSFKKMAETIESNLGHKIIKHILNSSGIVRFTEQQMDMVRLGIGLYGIEGNNIHQSHLQNISELKTFIAQIKKVKKGESIGYSRKGVAQKEIIIATIAIGYADGFSRAFGNGVGKVLVNGKEAKVIGNVCMDMTMIDITGIDASVGDEVLIFGQEKSIIELAKSINTIPYEILTSISERVKRVFYLD